MALLTGIQTFMLNNISNMVVKYSREAKKGETVESRRAADKYVSARLKTDSTLTYDSYSVSVIQAAAAENLWSLSEDTLASYVKDKNNIPHDRQEILVPYARLEYIENYVEKNPYYRILAGLPPIDAEDYYLADSVYESYDTPKVAIHKLPQYILNNLDELGTLYQLSTTNSDYKYMKYMGKKKIDILTARQADNFDILYIPSGDNYSNYRDFLLYYEESKAYITTVIYNIYLSSKYDLYDNYIAFTICIMALQKLVANTVILSVTRDFYDESSMRILMEAYGIPFSSVFSIYQNKLIVKNLNILLQKKQSDQVLMDIMDLLGFDQFTLIKYYLVKQHKLDVNDNPIFIYKTDEDDPTGYAHDENGNIVYDYDAMYDFYFKGIDIDNYDVQQALNTQENQVDYSQMIYDDPLWYDNNINRDSDLKQKLLDSEFNYVETKYLDINIVYRMHKIVFETIYLTRMILDKYRNTKLIMVSMGKLCNEDVSLFDLIVTLVALMCKYYEISPDLVRTPSGKLHIMGFNFKADFDAIRAEIAKHPDYYYDDLSKYITNVEFTNIDTINDMYVKVRDLERLLVKGMNKCETLEAYRTYKNLYDTLMFMNVEEDLFKMNNGTVATSFTQYLQQDCPALYSVVQNATTNDIVSEYINYITTRLSTMFRDSEYIVYLRIADGESIDALLRLLRFFQSYTLDIRTSKLTILLDSRYHNMVHFITKLQHGDVDLSVNDISIDAVDVVSSLCNTIKMYGSKYTLDRMRALVSTMSTDETTIKDNLDEYFTWSGSMLMHDPIMKNDDSIDQLIQEMLTDAIAICQHKYYVDIKERKFINGSIHKSDKTLEDSYDEIEKVSDTLYPVDSKFIDTTIVKTKKAKIQVNENDSDKKYFHETNRSITGSIYLGDDSTSEQKITDGEGTIRMTLHSNLTDGLLSNPASASKMSTDETTIRVIDKKTFTDEIEFIW